MCFYIFCSQDKSVNKEEEEEAFSVSPKKALRTLEFYIMWLGFLSISAVNSFINSYSKTFGQQFIQDDRFLSSMATLSSVMNGFSRIFWGKMFDLQGYQVQNSNGLSIWKYQFLYDLYYSFSGYIV